MGEIPIDSNTDSAPHVLDFFTAPVDTLLGISPYDDLSRESDKTSKSKRKQKKAKKAKPRDMEDTDHQSNSAITTANRSGQSNREHIALQSRRKKSPSNKEHKSRTVGSMNSDIPS